MAELAAAIDYGVTASALSRDTGTKFLRITDIQDGSVDWEQVPFCEAQDRKLRSARLDDGDIVFARTGATTGKSFLIKEPPQGAVFASYLIRVKPAQSIYPSYLAHYFQSAGYWSQILKKTQGAAQGGVNATSLSELEIPIPPLDQQRRIAAILDKADALRRKRRRAIECLDSLRQSIFRNMFHLSGGFHNVALSEVCQKITDGTHQSPCWSEHGVPFLFVSNIRNQQISFETNKFISEEEYAKLTKHCPIEPGDILYTAVGSYGHTAIVPAGQKFLFQRHVAQLKPLREMVKPQYLAHALEMPEVKRQADREARGVAQKTVTLESLKKIVIPLPPIRIQEQFEERIGLVERLNERLFATLASDDSLFQSLQQRAFRGRL
ncbi:restriction endonuclease subunit S [Bradyrhizobium sp. HKCCYLRH2060]|uniref:restriction endonuclease subunit S n=1 Tax=Bradyrhizobium sp. HKCCYLRH2060 TaxID=3420743 RepID=UPI003EBA1A70